MAKETTVPELELEKPYEIRHFEVPEVGDRQCYFQNGNIFLFQTTPDKMGKYVCKDENYKPQKSEKPEPAEPAKPREKKLILEKPYQIVRVSGVQHCFQDGMEFINDMNFTYVGGYQYVPGQEPKEKIKATAQKEPVKAEQKEPVKETPKTPETKKSKFQCSVCEQGFKTEKELAKHMKWHNKGK